MNIFFIRHGESEHNKFLKEFREAKNTGLPFTKSVESRDLPLTPDGREHIEKALKNLPDHIDRFYCSNHIRTRESADIVQKKYPHQIYQIDERINAAFLGSLDHKTPLDIEEITGMDFERKIKDDTFDFHVWGGESAGDVHNRVVDFLRDVCKAGAENVVVVTSLEVIKSVYKILCSDKAPDIMRYIAAKNGSVHRFVITLSDLK